MSSRSALERRVKKTPAEAGVKAEVVGRKLLYTMKACIIYIIHMVTASPRSANEQNTSEIF